MKDLKYPLFFLLLMLVLLVIETIDYSAIVAVGR